MNRVLFSCAALVAMAAVGCGSATEVVTRTVVAEPQPTPPRPVAPPRATPVRATPAPAAPLQTVTDAARGVRLELLSVARTGPAVVTAHMRLVAGDKIVWTDRFSEDGATENDFSGTRMVDEVHAKQYLPLKDTAGECLCTRGLGNMTYLEGPMGISVKFPAPAADVDAVSVQVPTFASFDAVPLS
jgi:hypothetical protein